MADWQRRVWEDIVSVDGVVPSGPGLAASSILVIGDGLPVDFSQEFLVVRRGWGEPIGDEAGFARIIVLVGGGVRADFQLLLTQMWRLLRPDGLLVLVVARPSPWGMRNSVWWRGIPLKYWKRWLKKANWLVADTFTVGFCAAWARWVPWGGPVRVILAQKRVGGLRILARTPQGVVQVKAAGIPV
jgi:SAM-dependent methyltransferase